MALGINDTITFGKKHKGKTVGAVIDADPGWLCWLRDARRAEGKPGGLTKQVHDLLDEKIKASSFLRKAHEPWNVGENETQLNGCIKADDDALAAKNQEDDRLVVAYAGEWGSW